ncbi:MAG: phosphodiester glycosidase family protein [Oscillospiraceae bacterium]|jgi:exopolysaccharide biosynthesis protein|nr:phosphodiester glycosidase family protein [Oscillospiraceae bacterium]
MTRRHGGYHKRIFPAWAVVCLDFTIFAAALVVFALFHHVLPQSMGQRAVVITDPAESTAMSRATSEPIAEQPGLTAIPGDFSASFPAGDTGATAILSYQSDSARVAVKKYKVGEAVCFVADVWVRDIRSLRSGLAKDQVGQGIIDDVVDMSRALNAVAAINGDYYGARAKGVVIRNGVLYRDSMYDDVCVIYEDGVMETYTKDEFSINDAIARKAWQAWSFGPELLDGGKAKTSFNSSVVPANPRSAIGYYEPGHYCLVVVDGRQQGYSLGLNMKDLSSFFETLGCLTAYNLDGGQSSMMTFEGELVNQPYNGGRPSSDIVYITP